MLRTCIVPSVTDLKDGTLLYTYQVSVSNNQNCCGLQLNLPQQYDVLSEPLHSVVIAVTPMYTYMRRHMTCPSLVVDPGDTSYRPGVRMYRMNQLMNKNKPIVKHAHSLSRKPLLSLGMAEHLRNMHLRYAHAFDHRRKLTINYLLGKQTDAQTNAQIQELNTTECTRPCVCEILPSIKHTTAMHCMRNVAFAPIMENYLATSSISATMIHLHMYNLSFSSCSDMQYIPERFCFLPFATRHHPSANISHITLRVHAVESANSVLTRILGKHMPSDVADICKSYLRVHSPQIGNTPFSDDVFMPVYIVQHKFVANPAPNRFFRFGTCKVLCSEGFSFCVEVNGKLISLLISVPNPICLVYYQLVTADIIRSCEIDSCAFVPTAVTHPQHIYSCRPKAHINVKYVRVIVKGINGTPLSTNDTLHFMYTVQN